MITKYKHYNEVPIDILIKRLNELSEAVTKGKDVIDREFTMRVPAELDHDADLILSNAARQLTETQAKLEKLIAAIEKEREYQIENYEGVVDKWILDALADYKDSQTDHEAQ